MAFITDTRISGITLAERFATFRANLADAAAKRKVYNTTVTELSALSDRDLADLGVFRSDIQTIARQAAYGEE